MVLKKHLLKSSSSSLTQLEQDFVAFFHVIGKSLGIDTLSTTIIALIYLSPEPLALEELAKKTGYSLASISLKARFLERLGFLETIKKPGSKKVYFFLEKDIPKKVKEHFLKLYQHKIAYEVKNLPQLIEEYQGKNLSALEKKQLALLKKYHEQMKQMEKIIKQIMEIFDHETHH